jgi:hypothetical protein
MYKWIRKSKKEKGEFTGCQVSSNSMSKPIHDKKPNTCNRFIIFFHIKNRLLAISQLWRWEMCFEGVEVEK